MPPEERFAVVIPARFASNRFPGKPLADIAGKSLIQRVWEQCRLGYDTSQILVATDDKRIEEHCRAFGADVAMTSTDCLTGTDRVHEAMSQRGLDYAINVQGDEPLVRPDDIERVRQAFLEKDCRSIVNAMAPITEHSEWQSLAVPKVVFDTSDKLLYMSRAPIPGNKSMTFAGAWKQVCIYGFSAEHLAAFTSEATKTPFEAQEDIEILRFVERGMPVQMVRVEAGTVAVDFPEDIAQVEPLLNERSASHEQQ